MRYRPALTIAMLAAAALTLGACSTSGSSTASAPPSTIQAAAAPSASASPSYDDSAPCTAFEDALTTGVPADIQASYQAENNQPLPTGDFVQDEAQEYGDPHIRQLITTWLAAEQADPQMPGYFTTLKKADSAVRAYCASKGFPITT